MLHTCSRKDGGNKCFKNWAGLSFLWNVQEAHSLVGARWPANLANLSYTSFMVHSAGAHCRAQQEWAMGPRESVRNFIDLLCILLWVLSCGHELNASN